MQNKPNAVREYSSIFVAGLKVDLPNFLAELLIRNYLQFKKITLPTVPFWQKEWREASPIYKDIASRYGMELPEVKNLLKVFDVEVLAGYFTETSCFCLKYLKLPNRQKLIYDLYLKQLKFLKVAAAIPSITIADTAPTEYKAPKSFAKKNKLSL